MDRERAIAALKAHERELRTAGVLSVSLFGSVARGEDSAHDVDLAVLLGDGFSASGLHYFSRLRALGNRLRHEYDTIREDRLWDIVQIDLPPLCAACEEALGRLREKQTSQ